MAHHALVAGILATLAILCGLAGLVLFRSERRAAEVRRRLGHLGDEIEPDLQPTIVRDLRESALPLVDRWLRRIPLIRTLDLRLLQAGLNLRAGALLLIAACLALAGAYAAVTFTHLGKAALVLGGVPGAIPFFYVNWKRQQRTALIDRQFPDALDLMTAALRSGLAFSNALQIVSEESPDPIAKEFRIVLEENRLGLDLRNAFQGMVERVDSTELRLFVTAVMLQRETGGNLSEILEGTAAVIRDRLRILGDVRSISAQGRLSGFILSALPIVIAVFLTVVAPEYMKILITNPVGKYLIGGAVVLQLGGYLAIRRIIAIKV